MIVVFFCWRSIRRGVLVRGGYDYNSFYIGIIDPSSSCIYLYIHLPYTFIHVSHLAHRSIQPIQTYLPDHTPPPPPHITSHTRRTRSTTTIAKPHPTPGSDMTFHTHNEGKEGIIALPMVSMVLISTYRTQRSRAWFSFRAVSELMPGAGRHLMEARAGWG